MRGYRNETIGNYRCKWSWKGNCRYCKKDWLLRNSIFDDDESIHECGGYPVVGKSSEAGTIDADVIVGIGNADIRKRIQESIPHEKLVTLIHPDAVIAEDV